MNIKLQSESENANHMEVLPPINMSNLEMSELKPYGEGELEFNQNTVPFDFDGSRLMWMTYKDKQIRELNIYHFEDCKNEVVHTFQPRDGMVSHVRFLKTD